nr:hypothetical protein Iba_chr01bCG6480 [Ipomoea batatas]
MYAALNIVDDDDVEVQLEAADSSVNNGEGVFTLVVSKAREPETRGQKWRCGGAEAQRRGGAAAGDEAAASKMVQFKDQWLDGQRTLVISSTQSDHKVTLAVNQSLASPSPPKLTVSYHERNWTPEYDIPPSKVWTLQPGLKHEPSTDILPKLGSRIIDDEVKCQQMPLETCLYAT